MAIKEGQPAPNFTLPGSDGKEHTLQDYAGKMLIVYFYPKDNTSGCTKESCAFGEMFADLQKWMSICLGSAKTAWRRTINLSVNSTCPSPSFPIQTKSCCRIMMLGVKRKPAEKSVWVVSVQRSSLQLMGPF